MSSRNMNRRLFLGAAATLTPGLIHAGRVDQRKIRSLVAEGVATPDTVLGKQALTLPPDLVAALQAGAQIRIRLEYPRRRDLLMFYGFVAGPGDPPAPLTNLPENDPRIFTILALEIDHTLVSMYPEPTFGMFGRTIAEPKPSPFFPNLTGRIAGVSGGFGNEGETSFSMLGGINAGDHATYARVARGSIDL
jgi:hypothetical protein